MPEQARDKEEAILATALRLFVARGFFGTPTSLISKEAGVATGTLFFYFKTKEDLIDTLYRRIKAEAAEAMGNGLSGEVDAKARLRRLGLNAVAWGIENPEKMQFMEQFAHSPFVSTSAQEEGMSRFVFLQDLIRDGIREGTIRPYDQKLIFCMMACTISAVVTRVAAAGTPAERDRIIGQGMDFVWNGIRAGSGPGERPGNTKRGTRA